MSALCICIIAMYNVYVCYIYIARIPLMQADLRRVAGRATALNVEGESNRKRFAGSKASSATPSTHGRRARGPYSILLGMNRQAPADAGLPRP